MSKPKTKKPNTNKSSSYRPKGATMTAKSTGANSAKSVSAKTQATDDGKIVRAQVTKNGETVRQTIKTTSHNDQPDINSANHNLNNDKTAQNEQHRTHDFTSAVPQSAHIHKPKYPKNWWVWFLVILGTTILAGAIATILGGKMFNFRSHTLPPLMVPKIVFPIAWAIIYIALGVAAFFAFVGPQSNQTTRRGDIIWFSINLLFNILWPLFFYRLDSLIVSTIICGIVVITAIITNYRFYYRSIAAGVIYSVYTLWLLYAFYLNLGICLLNA